MYEYMRPETPRYAESKIQSPARVHAHAVPEVHSVGWSVSWLGRSWGQIERSSLLFFLGLSVPSIEREGDITAARVGVVLVRFVLLPGLIASAFSGLLVGSM
jgi:hypothetical protein